MRDNIFHRKVETIRQRLHVLQQLTNGVPVRQPELLMGAQEELTTALEELLVAEEELQQQNEELVVTQRAVEAERQRYQDLFEYAPDGYLVTDVEGTIQEANRASATLLRVRQDFLVGKPLPIYFAAPDRQTLYTCLSKLVQQPQDAQAWEAHLQPRDGEAIPAIFTVAAARTFDGKVTALRWLLRDISARKRAEEELRQAKEAAEAANRTKDEFLATMSHELRTPLHIIMGYTDLMIEGEFGTLADEGIDTLQRVRRKSLELFELITALLDLSRLEVGHLPVRRQEVRIPEVLKELQIETYEVQEQSSLSFGWRIDTNLPLIYTDPGKLKMVLKNLFSNAIKFTEQGSVTVAAHARDNGVEISVSDTGIGISLEMLPVIFKPFRQLGNATTRQHGGVGLGLHIVKRLLELLGGKIDLESEVGRGSTFRVWIPPDTEL